MIIETKYDRGDTVWFMKDNKVSSGWIRDIFIHVFGGTTYIQYEVSNVKYLEFKLYDTKEELIASL